MSHYPEVVWKLTGETSMAVECWIAATDLPLCSLTITYGGEMVLHECYSDPQTARARAAAVRDDLLAKGWNAATAHEPVAPAGTPTTGVTRTEGSS